MSPVAHQRPRPGIEVKKKALWNERHPACPCFRLPGFLRMADCSSGMLSDKFQTRAVRDFSIVRPSEQRPEVSSCVPPGREPSLRPARPRCRRPRPSVGSWTSGFAEGRWWYHSACVSISLVLLNSGPKAVHVTSITVYCHNFSAMMSCY